MDCEGAEFELLDPARDPILATTHLLVEVHEAFGTADDLASRFSATHEISTVRIQARTPSDLPPSLSGAVPPEAMDERRHGTSWIYLQAKQPST